MYTISKFVVSGQFHDAADLPPRKKFRHMKQTCVFIFPEDGTDEKQEHIPGTEQQAQCLSVQPYTRKFARVILLQGTNSQLACNVTDCMAGSFWRWYYSNGLDMLTTAFTKSRQWHLAIQFTSSKPVLIIYYHCNYKTCYTVLFYVSPCNSRHLLRCYTFSIVQFVWCVGLTVKVRESSCVQETYVTFIEPREARLQALTFYCCEAMHWDILHRQTISPCISLNTNNFRECFK
jgi:hypothetical protein